MPESDKKGALATRDRASSPLMATCADSRNRSRYGYPRRHAGREAQCPLICLSQMRNGPTLSGDPCMVTMRMAARASRHYGLAHVDGVASKRAIITSNAGYPRMVPRTPTARASAGQRSFRKARICRHPETVRVACRLMPWHRFEVVASGIRGRSSHLPPFPARSPLGGELCNGWSYASEATNAHDPGLDFTPQTMRLRHRPSAGTASASNALPLLAGGRLDPSHLVNCLV